MKAEDLWWIVICGVLLMLLLAAHGCGPVGAGAGATGGQGIYIKADRQSTITGVEIRIRDGALQLPDEVHMAPNIELPQREDAK